jgi:hypothetical protein
MFLSITLEFKMIDIFEAWREAVNLGCVALSGDEACAGYYRIRDLSGFGEGSSKSLWLPVAIWWDKADQRFICLVDGHEADVVAVWAHCRKFPVPYAAYVLVAEQGGAWPDGVIAAETNVSESFDVCSDLRGIGALSSQDLKASLNASALIDQPEDINQLQTNTPLQPLCGPDISPDVESTAAASTVPHFDRANGQPEITHKTTPEITSAGLGHNVGSVPKDIVLSDTLSELERDCFGWLDQIGLIETQKQADQAGSFAERFSRLEKEAEEARTFEKRPVLEQGRAIDAKWKPIVTGASNGKKRMKRALEPFLIAERERLEAVVSIKGDGADITSPKAGLHGRKISLRSSYVLSITDEDALRDYFAQDKRFWRDKDVRLILKRLAEADIHTGRDVPGAELVQELTAA